jgi:Icc-related predicted phosphoesterase
LASHVIGTSLRICLVSDTHELHREIEIQPCDLLIHCGDFTFFSKRPSQIDDLNDWFSTLPAREVLLTCGNHEFAVEAEPEKWRRRLSNATLLLNEEIEIDGLRIWGSPTTPLYGGAFGLSNEADRERLYSTIPDETDILITHGPPLGVLDDGQGCAALRRAVIRVRPRLHCFGHVHSRYGTRPTARTMFVNASILDEDGAPSRKPILLNVSSNARPLDRHD